MIRLFVIEDHPVIIWGLKNVFKINLDEIEVIGSATNIIEAELRADVELFDLFILDLWIGKDDPLVNISHLKAKFPDKPIVIYSSEESGLWQRKVFSLGVTGYLFKSSGPTEIKMTIEKVFQGGISFPGVTTPADNHKIDGDFLMGQKSITNLQRELIQMIYKGVKQKEIARQKKVSVSTIEKTLFNLREKFSARNNADLIRILTDKGLF